MRIVEGIETSMSNFIILFAWMENQLKYMRTQSKFRGQIYIACGGKNGYSIFYLP